ncbi:MAG TPA: DUF1345 domain-containing protein [Kofleriaceae bacterium]|jgi:uncharacterized membrane protein|nr:DUF1345 domain-containing protein [Kofleriaceae bacterium]
MRAFHPLDPRRAGHRLVYAVIVGAVAWVIAGHADVSAMTRTVIAGDAGGFVLLAMVASIIATGNASMVRRRAAAEDPGRLVVWVIVLAVCSFSLFAAIFVLRGALALTSSEQTVVTGLALATAVMSWLLTHAAFTLRYAHLYYRGGKDDEGGIKFAGEGAPDHFDFAYFAFTIGMCFQVSDTEISDRLIRRTALAHAMLSFVYNTGILALVLNIVTARLG